MVETKAKILFRLCLPCLFLGVRPPFLSSHVLCDVLLSGRRSLDPFALGYEAFSSEAWRERKIVLSQKRRPRLLLFNLFDHDRNMKTIYII